MGQLEVQSPVDPEFVLPVEHRPGDHRSKIEEEKEEGIPVIDLQGLEISDSNRQAVVKLIGEAAQEWGFFQIINHGVPLELLDDVERYAKEFFALPVEDKYKVVRTADNAMGYFDLELTKNVRDWKQVFDYLTGERAQLSETQAFENQWPDNPPQFKVACRKYGKAVEELALRILELVLESLGQPPKLLHPHFEGISSTRIRLNHYAKCPAPELVLGVSRHKDACALTLLAQDEVGGLQVRRQDGQWIGVKPRRDAFAVNIGDLMQVWSNGRYQSVEHRVVVNSNKDRFSCPLFFGPSYSTAASPLSALVGETSPARYRPVNWGEYYKMRRDSNFKNLGKPNVQLDYWAISS